jgi:ankyrin repeat protein
LLLNHGANVNAKDNMGLTPVHATILCPDASKNTLRSILKLLVDHGADLNARDTTSNKYTPFHHAVASTIGCELNKIDAQQAVLDRVEILASLGADLRPETNKMLLHLAADRGHDSVAEALINRWKSKTKDLQALLETRSEINGDTALHIAVRNKHKRFARVLHAHHVRWDIKNRTGESPRMLLQTIASCSSPDEWFQQKDIVIPAKQRKRVPSYFGWVVLFIVVVAFLLGRFIAPTFN